MSRPVLEVADIFRDHGAAWRRANVGHVSLDQMKVMSAIERCRTAALGGHVARCEDCPHTVIAYNSCRNRHCPKCQRTAAKEWLAAREADLLPVPYFHVRPEQIVRSRRLVLLRPHRPLRRTTESWSDPKGNPQIKLQGFGLSSSKSLQSQTPPQPKNRLRLNHLEARSRTTT
jgi:hypothetical protein